MYTYSAEFVIGCMVVMLLFNISVYHVYLVIVSFNRQSEAATGVYYVSHLYEQLNISQC